MKNFLSLMNIFIDYSNLQMFSHLQIPFDFKEICFHVREVVKKQNVQNGYIRPVVRGGSEMMAISAEKASTNIAIACWEGRHIFSPERRKGINLTVAEWVRPSPKSAPTNSKASGLYMICFLK